MADEYSKSDGVDPVQEPSAQHGRVIAHAEALSRKNGVRFTPVRRRVLEILLEERKAVGAYDILKRLKAEGMKSQPPVAYRALEFLETHGFVHRIERLNAFVACTHPEEEHVSAFMICRVCRSVAETPGLPELPKLVKTAKNTGFEIETAFVEFQGLCSMCNADI